MAWEVPGLNIAATGQLAGNRVAGLFGDYQQGLQANDEQVVRGARRDLSSVPRGPNGEFDIQAASQQLLQAGDIKGAEALSMLALAQEDRKFRQAQFTQQGQVRQEETAYNRQRDQIGDQFRDRQLSIMGDRASGREVPSGYQANPETGGLMPIPGGPADKANQPPEREKPPTGFRYSAADPTRLEAIPGGPGEKIDAEVAARLGLTKSFLGQFDGIKGAVNKGELTGPVDGAMGAAGYGRPAELRRQIQSGVDALIRNLTGAGMSQSEAENYATRYAPGGADSAATVTSKLDQLKRELTSTAEVLGRGRGGSGFITDQGGAGGGQGAAPPQPQQSNENPSVGTRAQYEALPSGAVYLDTRDNTVKRKR